MNPGFEEIMSLRGRAMPKAGEVTITGITQFFTRFKVGETMANILVAVGD